MVRKMVIFCSHTEETRWGCLWSLPPSPKFYLAEEMCIMGHLWPWYACIMLQFWNREGKGNKSNPLAPSAPINPPQENQGCRGSVAQRSPPRALLRSHQQFTSATQVTALCKRHFWKWAFSTTSFHISTVPWNTICIYITLVVMFKRKTF